MGSLTRRAALATVGTLGAGGISLQSVQTLLRQATAPGAASPSPQRGVTADDPALTDVIRARAPEVTGFVQQGVPG